MKRRTNLSVLRDLIEIALTRRMLPVDLRPPQRRNLDAYGPNTGWSFSAQKAAADVWRLKVLHDHDDGVHERLNRMTRLKAYIDKVAVNGVIGLVESGRDCDCVEYVHPAGTIPATVAHYLIADREKAKWADGPFELSIVSPEEEANTPYESRDLVLEAFEDGHPHSIVSRFP
jgi:hypothetical protein